MSTLATSFVAIVAVLNGIILLGWVSPVSASQSLSFERELGKDFLRFSTSAVENSTLYYGACDGVGSYDEKNRLDCVLHRVKGDFSGGNPKEDKCDLTIKCEFGGRLILEFIKIDPLGRNRAIVRWAEEVEDTERIEHRFRLSIVDFSNCKVTTTNASRDLDRLIKGKIIKVEPEQLDAVAGIRNRDYYSRIPAKDDYNWPMYRKGEDDFEIVSIVYGKKTFSDNSDRRIVEVLTASIDADGVVAKVDTLLPPQVSPLTLLVYPLSKDQGYLCIANEYPKYPSWNEICCNNMTVSLIQPNGQMRHLTYVQDVHPVGYASVSLANEMIGICVRQNVTTMQCTQFRLDDQEIKWFPVSLYMEAADVYYGAEVRRGIHNLPRGEGFLTKIFCQVFRPDDEYLLKVGLDGKVKQFLNPDMQCSGSISRFNKIFEDDQGNYCVSTTCLEQGYGRKPTYHVKLQSKCFEPEDFKNISKYEVIAGFEDGYPRRDTFPFKGLYKYELLIE